MVSSISDKKTRVWTVECCFNSDRQALIFSYCIKYKLEYLSIYLFIYLSTVVVGLRNGGESGGEAHGGEVGAAVRGADQSEVSIVALHQSQLT